MLKSYRKLVRAYIAVFEDTGALKKPSIIPHLRLFTKSGCSRKQRRVSRWLHNSRINVHRLYKPLILAALANWEEECLYLTLDTSMYWEEYCLVRLAVVYRGRALPLVWRVLKHKSASVAFNEYREMLYQAAHLLPKGVKVVLLADRGFIHVAGDGSPQQ